MRTKEIAILILLLVGVVLVYHVSSYYKEHERPVQLSKQYSDNIVLPPVPSFKPDNHQTSNSNLSYGQTWMESEIEMVVEKLYANENLLINIQRSNHPIKTHDKAERKFVQRNAFSNVTMGDNNRRSTQMVGQVPLPIVVKKKIDIPSDKLRAMSIVSATTGIAASAPMFAPVHNDATLPPPPFTTYVEDQLGVPLDDGMGVLLLLLLIYAFFVRLKR